MPPGRGHREWVISAEANNKLGNMKNVVTIGFLACMLAGCGKLKPEEGTPQMHEVRPVTASTYDLGDCGEVLWNSDHNGHRLTVTNDGLTIEWDGSKDKAGETAPVLGSRFNPTTPSQR